MSNQHGPLEGVKVLEWTLWWQGPAAGVMLGDLGADVIKIEPPTGDPARGHKLVGVKKLHATKRQSLWEGANRNKRNIVLDLSKDKGREVTYKLVERSDIFLHNYSPGIPEKLGMDYDTLSQYNPKLIYAQSSGWGPKGPRSLEAAYEQVAMGVAGTFYMMGDPDSPPPIWIPGLADQIGGIMAVLSILAALYAREQWGIGQKVDVSLLGSLICLESLPLSSLLIGGIEFPRRPRTGIGNPLINNYQCSDGEWLTVQHLQADNYWHDWCKALGIEELEHDPRFENLEVRAQNAAQLISIHERIFATKTRDEWVEILRKHNLIVGPILKVSDTINNPQVLVNEYITEYDHPQHGRTRAVGFPYRFSKTPASVRRPPPEFGQYTEEILLELGYSWDGIVELKDEGVIP